MRSFKQTPANLSQCLSLVKYLFRSSNRSNLTASSKYMHHISPILNPDKSTHPSKHPKPIHLNIGAPDSSHPVIKSSGCRHCVPVIYYPAHCELSFHLRDFVPPEMLYCVGCAKYTLPAGYYIDRRFAFKSIIDAQSNECGKCGTSYWRRFERGRRMIGMSDILQVNFVLQEYFTRFIVLHSVRQSKS